MPSSNPGVGARLCQLVSNSTTAVRYGTVRYIGPVEGTSGTWLGVEWDLDGKGKHDGSHGGERYFSCSRPGPIASFIRGEGGSLNVGGVTFLEALSEKYVANSSGSVTASTHTHQQQQYSRRNLADIEIEIPNIEKVSARVKNLHRLRTVALVGPIERTSSVGEEDNAPSRAELIEEIKWTVGHLGEDDSIAQSIADTIPNVTYLDLSRSLFDSWEDIATTTRYLNTLQFLDLHYTRLRLGDSALVALSTSQGLQSVQDLGLDRTRTSWNNAALLVQAMPNLRVIHLANNHIHALGTALSSTRLEELNLQGNEIEEWEDVARSVGGLQSLKRLHLNKNRVRRLSTFTSYFPALEHLGINENPVWSCTTEEDVTAAFESLYTLQTCCPALTSLNAVLQNASSSETDSPSVSDAVKTWTMHAIARLPRLQKLNGTTITPTQRRDAELWWLGYIKNIVEERLQSVRDAKGSVDSDVVRGVVEEMERIEPRWKELRSDDDLSSFAQPKAQNNLKSKFIHVTLHLAHGDIPTQADDSLPVSTKTVQDFPLLPTWTVKVARGKVLRALGVGVQNRGVRWVGVLSQKSDEQVGIRGSSLLFEMDDQNRQFSHWGLDEGDEVWCFIP